MKMATRIDHGDTSLGLQIEKSVGNERSRVRIPAQFITDFSYADDIVLFAMNLINSQLLLSKVEHFADEIGLKINVTKTIYICIGEEHDDNIKLYVESGFIERVDDFKYLGSWIKNSAKEISCRIGTAFTAAKQFKLIWRSQLPRKLKRLFFMSTVQSILFYAVNHGV